MGGPENSWSFFKGKGPREKNTQIFPEVISNSPPGVSLWAPGEAFWDFFNFFLWEAFSREPFFTPCGVPFGKRGKQGGPLWCLGGDFHRDHREGAFFPLGLTLCSVSFSKFGAADGGFCAKPTGIFPQGPPGYIGGGPPQKKTGGVWKPFFSTFSPERGGEHKKALLGIGVANHKRVFFVPRKRGSEFKGGGGK